jgi:hypothetical protein
MGLAASRRGVQQQQQWRQQQQQQWVGVGVQLQHLTRQVDSDGTSCE